MSAHADELRTAFDAEFAAALPSPESGRRDVLCIQVAREPYAIRLGDIASLHAELRVVALPARAPELLGVAAIRATVVPIYDLAVALGMSGAAAKRWAVVHRAGTAGFAFERYDGHVRIAETAISTASRSGPIAGQLVIAGRPRLIIDLDSVVEAIEKHWNPRSTAKGK